MLLTLYVISSLSFGIFGLVQGILSFDTQTLAVAADFVGLPLAYVVIALASISEGLGKTSVVLLANRLDRRASLVYVLLSALVFVADAGLLISVVWMLADIVFQAYRPFPVVVRFIGLGYLPLVWSFFVLVPCLGPGVRLLIQAWSFGIMVVIAGWVFDLVLWQAVIPVACGWLAVYVLQQLVKRPASVVARWLLSLATGEQPHSAVEDLPRVLPIQTLGIV